MPGAPIVIEVSLPSPPETGLALLTAACTRAALGARCVLAKDAREEVPAAVAIVTFETADNVRVEVGVRHGEHDVWRTSEFSFLAGDDGAERWRTLGFAIGTLAESEQNGDPGAGAAVPPLQATPNVGASAEASAPPPPDPEPGSTPKLATASAPAPAAPRPRVTPSTAHALYLDVAGLLGRGLDPNPLRAGAGFALDLPVPRTSLYVLGGASMTVLTAERNELSSARWVDVSLGGLSSVLGDAGRSGFELVGQGLLERFDVSASTLDGRSDARGRWLFGLEAGLRGRLGLSQTLCLTADLRLAALSGATSLRVASTPLGEAPALRYTAGLGLRVRVR